MNKLRFIAGCFFTVVFSLVLVSCGGQPTKPDDDSDAKVSKAAEAEPPAIEIIARKDLDAPKISMEPLPADELVEEPKAEEPKSSEAVVSDEVKQEVPAKEAIASESKEVTPPVAKSPEPPVAAPTKVPTKAPTVPAKAPTKKVQIPVPAARPAPALVSADPNTFIVTVGAKAAPHPSLGKGHAMGFLINGVSGKRLVLERGKSYTFDIRTDAKHDVYLSKKVIGWGSAPIAEGVTGAYTYKGKMVFSPTASTPDSVFYACPIKQPATSTRATASPQAPVKKVTASKVKQKLMFAEMMSKSKGSRRVLASQNDEAKQLLVNAKSRLSEGREKSLVGALPEALALANKSLKMMSEATRLVPGEEEMAQLAEDYKSSLDEIRGYQKSHKANLMRLVKTGSVPEGARYDEADVNKRLSEAQALVERKNYIHANAVLGKVQQTITVALYKMLDSTRSEF